MNEKHIELAQETQRFLKKNNRYFENKHGLIDFSMYLNHFANIYGVYTFPFIIPYVYKEDIIKKYAPKFVCTKVYQEGRVFTSIVQLNKFDHFVFDYINIHADQENQRGSATAVAVKCYSKHQSKCASDFMARNEKYVYKNEKSAPSFGFLPSMTK